MIDRLAVTPSGRVWVKRNATGREVPGIDVFSSQGTYIGTLSGDVPFPDRFLPDGRMAVIQTDSLDIQRLAVYDVAISGNWQYPDAPSNMELLLFRESVVATSGNPAPVCRQLRQQNPGSLV